MTSSWHRSGCLHCTVPTEVCCGAETTQLVLVCNLTLTRTEALLWHSLLWQGDTNPADSHSSFVFPRPYSPVLRRPTPTPTSPRRIAPPLNSKSHERTRRYCVRCSDRIRVRSLSASIMFHIRSVATSLFAETRYAVQQHNLCWSVALIRTETLLGHAVALRTPKIPTTT